MQFWAVGTTHWHEERRAAANVERQGHEYYLPEILEVGARGTQRRSMLFPGYIFVRIDGKRGWSHLGNTRGLSRMISQGESLSRMPDSEIKALRAAEVDGFVRPSPRPVVGDKVRVGDGGDGFSGVTGLVQGMRSNRRVQILMDILGRPVTGVFDELALTVV